MGSVILYETKRRIWLTMDGDALYFTRNLPMHDPDFLCFKDSQTDIEFIIRNVDRKPIDITGRTLYAVLVDYNSGATFAKIRLENTEPKRGLAKLSLYPYMLKDIPLGNHRYTISYMLDNGNAKLLAQDQFNRIDGFFQVQYGQELQGIQSQSYDFKDFYSINSNRYDTYYVTPNFQGNLQNGSLDGLHTFGWYLNRWSGTIWMEGSLAIETPTESDWFPIKLDHCTSTKLINACGIVAHNVKMNLMWIRFKFWNDPLNTGTIEKVMLRK